MRLSKNKTIIEYIPIFLEYCKKEKHFLPKSIENYSRFLTSFITYLKNSNQIQLFPHQLSDKHIRSYKSYLSNTINSVTKQSISKVTQNLYLIALRALLSYFNERNINSLSSDKVKLLKQNDYKPKNILLTSEQLKKLFSAPDITKINGLRDRVILEILLSTGLKINKIVALNKNDIEFRPEDLEIKILDKVSHSKNISYWLKKYLKTRQDNERALFINYRGRKNAPRRLTDRSVERGIKKYITDNNLPSLLTPETLRNVYIFHLLNQDIKITNSLTHKVIKTRNYSIKSSIISCNRIKETVKFPIWNTVENTINKEMSWLKEKISVMPVKYRSDRLLQICDDCFFRKLAILIVSGKVKATEFRAKDKKSLWSDVIRKQGILKVSRHGKEWHRKMMNIVSDYFNGQNYKIALEPALNFGRADLGINLNQKEAIYIEVGTVSLFKLWYNLSAMENTTFLLIPFEEYVIEFKT